MQSQRRRGYSFPRMGIVSMDIKQYLEMEHIWRKLEGPNGNLGSTLGRRFMGTPLARVIQ